MNVKLSFIVLFIGAISMELNAQNFEWSKRMGGPSIEEGLFITTDQTGNVYTTGHFQGTVDFDPSDAVYSLTSAGGSDVFITKLDPFGNFEWAKCLGGTSADEGSSIATDADGNIYVTGYFQGTVDFDPSDEVFSLTSVGNGDVFICKIDSSGNFIWTKQFGGISFDIATSISIDANGNIYTSGYFWDTADFDPSENEFNIASVGFTDIFISKLDASGNFLWANSLSGASNENNINSMTLDSDGNVYTTGFFEETIDFDPSEAVFSLTSNGNSDIFISKLDATGNFVWAKSFGGNQYDESYSIVTDAEGNLYTTGYFSGTVDFDPSETTFNLTSDGLYDVFISKLDNLGKLVWAKRLGGSATDFGYAISTDLAGNVYTTGIFKETADFDPSEAISNLISAGSNDVFISKLDSSGNFVWAKQLGGSSTDFGKSITTDDEDNIYVTGYFFGTADFDPSEDGIQNLSAVGASDIFVLKLNQDVLSNDNFEVNSTVEAYPNPFINQITLSFTNENTLSNISIFDMTGKLIDQIKTEQISLEVGKNWSKGVYVVQIEQGQETRNIRIIKQ